MLYPAPTSKIDPSLARGVLEAITEAAPGRPGQVVISYPNTSYQLHLVPSAPVTGELGKRIIGTIHAKARRIDVVKTGGRYVEPVYGRPRRIQGSVIGVDAARNLLVVDATMPIHIAPTDPRQKAGDFKEGDFVSFDALDGATFTQV